MKIIIPVIFVSLLIGSASAQTVGKDFNRADCNGNTQHLFADLDAGNVVIIEYFMLNCGSCITAGNKLEKMKTGLEALFPGKIKSYKIGYSDSYSCASISSWVSTYGYDAIPMDKGASEVAYYGGMGMPTIVVLGGTDHKILGSPYLGFQSSDTTSIKTDVYAFFGFSGVDELANEDIQVFPNPVKDQLVMKTSLNEAYTLSLIDVQGREVKTMNVAGSTAQVEVPVSDLENGWYTVLLKTTNGVITRKISILH